jgi:hypothetical protein
LYEKEKNILAYIKRYSTLSQDRNEEVTISKTIQSQGILI